MNSEKQVALISLNNRIVYYSIFGISIKGTYLISLAIIFQFLSCKTDANNPDISNNPVDSLDRQAYSEVVHNNSVLDTIPIVEEIVSDLPDSLLNESPANDVAVQQESPVKPKKPEPRAVIFFEEMVFDFGEITEGDTVQHEFHFINKGNAGLVIQSAKASCGCTQPSYPFMAVEPQKHGHIGIRYISVGKEGDQDATIRIKYNGSDKPVRLLIKGKVNPKEN